jgi:PilZ domain
MSCDSAIVDIHRIHDRHCLIVSTQAQRQERTDAGHGGKTRRRARVDPRVVVRCGCWLEHDGATVYGSTVDLGRGGLFLRTALPMPPGVAVRVTLHLPEHGSVEAEGHIVHRIAPSEAERPGLGVRFDRLTEGYDALHAFLGLPLEGAVPRPPED